MFDSPPYIRATGQLSGASAFRPENNALCVPWANLVALRRAVEAVGHLDDAEAAVIEPPHELLQLYLIPRQSREVVHDQNVEVTFFRVGEEALEARAVLRGAG